MDDKPDKTVTDEEQLLDGDMEYGEKSSTGDNPLPPCSIPKMTLNFSPSSSPNITPRTDEILNTPSPIHGYTIPASPPQFVGLDQLMKYQDDATNMSLAHEIAVNADFKLNMVEPERDSVEGKIRSIMKQAFWDNLRDTLSQDPPDYTHALILLEETKENLFFLLPKKKSNLREQVRDGLDLTIARQEAENQSLNVREYASFVIDVLSQLCAPVRDKEVASLRTLDDVVELFKRINDLIELMKVDLANFHITQIRPFIQQQSVEYETTKFSALLQTQRDSGLDGLKLTKVWLREAFDLSIEKFNQSVGKDTESHPGTSSPNRRLPSPAIILTEAYLLLLDKDDKLLWAETTIMDQSRFMTLGSTCARAGLVASVVLVCGSCITIVGDQQYRAHLVQLVDDALASDARSDLDARIPQITSIVLADIAKTLADRELPPMTDTSQSILKGQLLSLENSDSKVRIIISTRIRDFLRRSAVSKHSAPLQVPAGLGAIHSTLSPLIGQFLRLIAHNRAVYGSWYAGILTDFIQSTDV